MIKVRSLTLYLLGLALVGAAQAAVQLPNIDCQKGTDARCKLSSSNAGKMGSGLPLDLGGFVSVGSGYVDEASNSLIVPVEFGSQQDAQGVIMRVDLKTGNRTIISGYDGEEWHGKGVSYVSDRGEKKEAYDLGRVMVVRAGPAGSILALVDKGLQQRTELLNIDPQSGDRTLIWASRGANDAEKVRPDAITQIEKTRFNFSSDNLCTGGDKSSLKPSSTFETDGTNAYFFMANNPSGTGIGLVKVPLTGGKCTWVSQYWPNGQSDLGSGPTVNTLTPPVFGSALLGKEFVAATGPNPNGNTLFAIDITNGTRRTLSLKNAQTPARSKGDGDTQVGYLGTLALGAGQAATLRALASDAYPDLVLVDLQSGNRTLRSVKAGSLSSGRDSDANIVAAIPNTHKYIVAFNKGLHIFDADTGNSYLLSQ